MLHYSKRLDMNNSHIMSDMKTVLHISYSSPSIDIQVHRSNAMLYNHLAYWNERATGLRQNASFSRVSCCQRTYSQSYISWL